MGLRPTGAEPRLLAALIPVPTSHRERPASLRSPPETALETPGPELDVEAADEEAATLAEPGPQPCLHISIAGSGLEMAPGPAEGDPRPELVPFDSDSDDESSPSPSGTLQSQASRSTISSSFGSECPAWGCQAGWTAQRRGHPAGTDGRGGTSVGKGMESSLKMPAHRAVGASKVGRGAVTATTQRAVGRSGRILKTLKCLVK